jgi:Ig-like domain from next to BRCA1 gene
MKPRFKAASILLLCAMLLSFVPAAMTPGSVSAAQTCTDRAQFVSDVTVPDGTRYDAGTAFKKTWRLKNVGTCTWTTSYSLVFDSGERMGGPASTAFTGSVAPGATVDMTIDLTAPTSAGRYRGYWKFKNAAGVLFGIGAAANRSWWVEINVTGSAPTGSVVLDFINSAKDATWSSGAGGISVNGTDGDAKGFAIVKASSRFESGLDFTRGVLLMGPQNVTNGFVQGVYPEFKVEGGDTFQATIGCESGATACYVAYRLDYQVGNTIKTFWTFRERNEGLTYNANISLAPLAGQTVKFILYISAYGSPAGDRALWGNPVITRKGIVPPPITITPGGPTLTHTPTRTPAPVTVTVPPSACDKAQFIADVNVPDGTTFQPGATFTKTWRLKNVGSCAWSTSYQLVFFSGEQMGAAASAPFPQNVAIGQTVNISINMKAPSAAGSYRGYWMFKNASGALFGIGTQGNKPWWVDIRVAGPTVTPGGPTQTPTPTVTPGGPSVTPVANSAYDFAANACAASWFSGAGALPCPGTDNDNKGFVLKVTNPKLETGAIDPRPALLTFPQALNNGYIQGFYPPFRVQNGDRFRSTINCEGGATLCYVAFRLDYQTGSDPIRTLWGPFLERVDNPPRFFNMDVDLSSLAGKDVKFILTVLSAGSAQHDRALWVGPYIYRAGATGVITPIITTVAPTTAVPTTAVPTTAVPTTPVATTPPASTSYQNSRYGFKFTLPAGATIANQTDNLGRVNLPLVTPGTNLSEKYIQVSVTEGKNPCVVTDFEGGEAIERVTINNIQFDKQTGQGVAAGNIYDWTGYSTVRNNACIILAFILHSTNPANHATPPPVFDKAKESEVINTVMNTFSWLTTSGRILISDDFSSPGWGTGSDAESSVSYENNTLKFLVSAKNFFVWSNPNGNDYKDIHLEVSALNNGTHPSTAFGIICDQHGEDTFSFYFFAMTPAGEYAIVKAASGQPDVFLTNNGQWGYSDLIAQNAASYRIGADCGMGKLTMYVDGKQIASVSVSDPSYTAGTVALFTWSGEEAESANVSFDNFLMTEL